jgi:hypothetical protein
LRRPHAVATALFLAALLALASRWLATLTAVPCAEPACAELRYRLHVELDVLSGAESVPVAARASGHTLDLDGLLSQGGIAVEVLSDGSTLPYDPSAGALDEADLLAYAEAWSSRDVPAGSDARVYAISAPELRSANGDLLFGVLFDHAGREAIAVAPTTTRRLFAEHEATLVSVLQLRTFAHELLHALNRHHVDAAQSADERLTAEAPTHCIADASAGGWRLREVPLWALSPSTIRHFQSARAVDVLPGYGSSPFDLARGTTRDCELARRTPMGRPRSWLERIRGDLPRLFESAWAAEAEPILEGEKASAELRIEAQQAPYPLGFPIIVRVHVTNTGAAPLALLRRLAPAYGILIVETRVAGDLEWRPLRPLQTLEAIDDTAELPPGGATAESIEIYFGEDGWTFPTAGHYEVRARMRLGNADEEVTSEPITILVDGPNAAADQRALAAILSSEGALDTNVGRFLALRGRIRSDAIQQRVDSVLRDAPETALAAAFRLAEAGAVLRAPIDPATGRRKPPDLPAARRLLSRICRDSGLAALGRILEDAAARDAPTETEAVSSVGFDEAWEGAGATEAPRRLRYGDPALELAGAPIGFLSGGVSPPSAAIEQARAIGAELRERSDAMVLVAGHSDGAGTCEANEAIGLARARAIAREISRTGVPPESIEVVSLGANRPLDFASPETAQARNRRVEVWVLRPSAAPTLSRPVAQ